jgi:pimeloyl-[acyl-carrier protein] methyl ester esterase
MIKGRKRGQGKIQKIAFLHGWGLNRQVWSEVKEQLAVLAPSLECQLLDLPGYGGAVDIQDAHKLDSLAKHCLQQIDEPVVLVGWSLGGMVAMQAALLEADSANKCIQGLQLITTAPKFVSSDDWPCGVDLAIFQRFSDELARDYKNTLTMFLLLQAGSNKGSRELARSAHKAICGLPSPSAKTLQDGIDCLASADLRGELSKISLPSQVISGVRDRVANPESSSKLADLLNAELVEFNAGHSPFMTNASDYIQCLLAFIQSVQESHNAA